MSVYDRFGVFPAVAVLALAPALPQGLAQPAPAAGIGGATVTVGAVSTDEERVACQFAIVADNNIGEDVWILFSESLMVPGPTLRNSDNFETMSDRRLSPGERLNVRYEVGGRCGATRHWFMYVRIGPRGGEKIQIIRGTDDPSDRTIHLGEAACWATAPAAPDDLPQADRRVDRNDEAAGCDPETTRYGMVPAEETDDPAADRPAEEVDVTDRPAEEVDVDQFQGNWVRVESNNPRNNGMRIRVEGDRATITAMPPRGSSRLSVGQVVWDDVSDDGSLAVRGSDGAFYPSKLTMEGSNRLQLDIDLANSPGNDQTWERAGPSIDGDWVLYYTLKAYEQNWGIRVRVEGDRATIRYVPPTADREYRVGDIIWREFSPSDRTSASLYSFESLFGGSTYEPALMSSSTRYEDRGIRSIRIRNEADTRTQLWGRPEKAEEVIANGVGADEEEGALLDLPREPVGDPSAPEEDLAPSDDLPNADTPEDSADDLPTSTLQGTVRDAAGTPLRQVSVLATVSKMGYDAITGPDGVYGLDLEITEPEALVTVVFTQLDEDGVATGNQQITSLTLRPGQTTTLNQTLGGTGGADPPAENESTADPDESQLTVAGGVVFEDLDGDGVRDPGEAGRENVAVGVFDPETGALMADERGAMLLSFTDADGRWRYETTGTFELIFRVMDTNLSSGEPYSEATPAEHHLVVDNGEEVTDADFAWEESAEVSVEPEAPPG